MGALTPPCDFSRSLAPGRTRAIWDARASHCGSRPALRGGSRTNRETQDTVRLVVRLVRLVLCPFSFGVSFSLLLGLLFSAHSLLGLLFLSSLLFWGFTACWFFSAGAFTSRSSLLFSSVASLLFWGPSSLLGVPFLFFTPRERIERLTARCVWRCASSGGAPRGSFGPFSRLRMLPCDCGTTN